MLSMVFLLPTGFALLIWRTYRSAAQRSARGELMRPPGTIRWDGDQA